jgi:hypothetical protein
VEIDPGRNAKSCPRPSSGAPRHPLDRHAAEAQVVADPHRGGAVVDGRQSVAVEEHDSRRR